MVCFGFVTRDHRMEGTDESTELWWSPPKLLNYFKPNKITPNLVLVYWRNEVIILFYGQVSLV